MEGICDNLGEKTHPHRILERNPKTEEHFGRFGYKEGIALKCVLKK